MKLVSRVLEELAYVFDELGQGRLYIGPLVTMTRHQQQQQARDAFEFGREAGPPPPVAKVLHLRRVEE